MSSEEPTALDAILGLSPHCAALTSYGIFCPACSDPFKMSFVKAELCEIAILTVPHTIDYGSVSRQLGEAGLAILSSKEMEAMREVHIARRVSLGGEGSRSWG